MERCARCGAETESPETVVYADKGARPEREPFSICSPCFEESEHVEVQQWEADASSPQGQVLRTRTIRRYRKVKGEARG